MKKVFITVKTYPTISKKYDELVCTAGILEDGSWVRIYPLPFRKLDFENRYKKYQWIELALAKNESDPRPESFKVTDISKIKMLHTVDTKNNWNERKRIIFKNQKIYTNRAVLVEMANSNQLSLAFFKPSAIKEFIWEAVEREWPEEKRELLKSKAMQLSMFQTPEEVQREFEVVQKLPYKFSYRFLDDAGNESTLMIEDWEIGALYWNCLKECGGNEQCALQKVKDKYLAQFADKDVTFFLGTTKQFHGWAKNPFVIVGVFYPPIQYQLELPL
jgi:hypothetical protein